MSLETALVDHRNSESGGGLNGGSGVGVTIVDSKSRPSKILLNNKFTDFAKTRTGELAAKTINIKSAVAREGHADTRRYDHLRSGTSSSSSSSSCCCSRKCACVMCVFAFVFLDVFLNAFFVTYSFTSTPRLGGRESENPANHYDIRLSLVDIWLIAIVRDFVLLVAVSAVAIRHQAVYRVVKFIHRSYLSAFLCLLMYGFAMAKMLLHADKRPQTDQTNMSMLIWNIFASFAFFISFYMLALLKVKKASYSKTDLDDAGENGGEEDAFIETLKETNKKRTSLIRIFRYSGPDLPIIAVGTFFLITGAVADAFVPYYTGQVLDSIMVQRNFEHFKSQVIWFIGVNFLSGMMGGLRTCAFSLAVARLNVRLRKLVFKALIDQDISFFDKIKTGEMISRLTADTTTMSDLISQNLNGFLWNLVKTIGTLAFILKLSWQLSLTCFIGAPIVFAVGKLYGNYYKKLSSRVQKCMAEANNVAEQSLSTIRTVRSFANEHGEMFTYAGRLKDMLALKIKQALIHTSYDWAVKIAELVMTVSMLGYGAYLVTTSQISSGDFISFVIFQLTLGQCLEGLTSVYTGLMNAAGASEKIFEYLDPKPELQASAARAYEPHNLRGAIEFRNVSFTYPTRPEAPVLQNVTFSVRPGEIVALVGPSGSGKSSCINLLERFYKPDRGEILVDGVSLFEYDHKYIHRVIALVGQEPVLYAKKIKENIAYGLEEDEFSDEDVFNAARMANAYNFIMETPGQFDTECGERGTQLSGGQKQRIAIARALIRKPTILLLDEATSALDAESEYLVQQAIHKNLKGRTVLVVAHRLSTIENADKIIVLDHGQIVEQGTHRELLKSNGLYAQLVHKQIMHGTGDADSTTVGSKSGASTPTPSLTYFSSPVQTPTKLNRNNNNNSSSFHTDV